MAFLVGGANSLTGAYGIDNSCRFNDDDDAYLTVTGSSTTSSGKTSTLSIWVKRSKLGAEQYIFHARSADSQGNFARLEFTGDDTLRLRGYSTTYLETDAEYRDPSAWYHIVLALDTDTSGDGNSCRLYVNGSEVTSFSTDTNPSTDDDLVLGSDRAHYVGASFYGGGAGSEFDGYISELHFIDGQQLTPSSFGESDEDSGIWKPKQYSGSYGGNGFFLEFKQTGTGTASVSTIGADTSGNTSHLTSTNLAATDVTTDTPTNNFCTINPIYKDSGNNTVAADYSEGNTKMLTTVDGWKFGRGTFLLTSGKWYAEVKATEAGNGADGNLGIVPSQGGVALGESDDNAVFEGCRVVLSSTDTNLQKLDTGTGSNVFTDFASGNTAHLAIDLDNNKLWVGKEGTWYNDDNASTTLDASNEDITLPAVTAGWLFGIGVSRNSSDNITWEYNWGNPPNAISSGNADADGYGNFEFAVPSGFYAVCTKNLAEYG